MYSTLVFCFYLMMKTIWMVFAVRALQLNGRFVPSRVHRHRSFIYYYNSSLRNYYGWNLILNWLEKYLYYFCLFAVICGREKMRWWGLNCMRIYEWVIECMTGACAHVRQLHNSHLNEVFFSFFYFLFSTHNFIKSFFMEYGIVYFAKKMGQWECFFFLVRHVRCSQFTFSDKMYS